MIAFTVEDTDFGLFGNRVVDTSRHCAGEDLTETDLHYSLFPCRVTLNIDGVALVGPRRRVPLFDFLACVARLVKALREEVATSMGFTESADRVHVRPVGGGNVEISTSDSDLIVQIGRLELIDALVAFLADGRALLTDNIAGIQRNPMFSKLET
ncbi:hypothetical protein R8Z50_25180 [Longispora sp. K20-0274]|uniref:hypothetical protein n=1 Tax=Longispora sp. K20-0274 TaxID=3088255 RepID=UPI003999EE3D